MEKIFNVEGKEYAFWESLKENAGINAQAVKVTTILELGEKNGVLHLFREKKPHFGSPVLENPYSAAILEWTCARKVKETAILEFDTFAYYNAGSRINRGLRKANETVIIKNTEKEEGVSVGTKVRKCRYKGRKCRQNEV